MVSIRLTASSRFEAQRTRSATVLAGEVTGSPALPDRLLAVFA